MCISHQWEKRDSTVTCDYVLLRLLTQEFIRVCHAEHVFRDAAIYRHLHVDRLDAGGRQEFVEDGDVTGAADIRGRHQQ